MNVTIHFTEADLLRLLFALATLAALRKAA
jgi:hypothetical protein